VQNPVYAEPHPAFLPFGFDVDVACPLVKGVAEQVIDCIYDVLVIGGQFIRGAELDILFQVPQIDGRKGEFVLGCGNGSFESEEFIDQFQNIRFRAHHRPNLQVAYPGDILHDLHVEGIGSGNGKKSVLDGDGQNQVLHGEGVGNGGGDEIEIEL
jgi:hypothetical protein